MGMYEVLLSELGAITEVYATFSGDEEDITFSIIQSIVQLELASHVYLADAS